MAPISQMMLFMTILSRRRLYGTATATMGVRSFVQDRPLQEQERIQPPP